MWYVGMTKTLTATVKSSNFAFDAPEISFKWKVGRNGEEHSITPTHSGDGLYSVDVTPDKSGMLYVRWDTDGMTDVVKEQSFRVKESVF